MRAQEFIVESVDADQVLQYVKRVHAPDEFNIEYSITDHPRWELKSIPLSKLKLDPEGEHQDPYSRVNWVDYDKVQDLIPKITSVLKSMPIVVDPQGWIIDGNHRATAASEAGLKSVPAYVPAAKSINEIAMSGSQLPGQWIQNNNYKKIYDFHTDKNHYRAHFEIDDTYDDEDDSVNGKTMFAYFLAQLPNGQWTDNITNINEPDTIKIYSTMAGLIQQILKSHPDISSVSIFGRERVNNIYQKLLQRNITKLLPGWQATSQGIERLEPAVAENFADGKVKGKSRPGRVKRAGASCSGSVTDLRAKARKYGGEKGKMYHWCANMKGGKKK